MRTYSENFGIQTRKSGLRAIFKYREDDGTWKQVNRALSSTKIREAKKEAALILEELKEQALLDGATSALVSEHLKSYIEAKALKVEASTLSQYRQIADRLINPFIGNIALRDLNPDTVQKWQVELSKSYVPGTCKKALVLLRSSMKKAVDNDLLSKDPTRGVEAPKSAKRHVNALDLNGVRDVLTIMDSAPASAHMLGIRIAMLTGLREGEVCGLRWMDVDLANYSLTVRQSIGRGDKGNGSANEFYVKDPKTGDSGRTVYFGQDLAIALAERRDSMEAACKEAGTSLSPELYVIGGIDGRFMQPQMLSKRWKAFAEAFDFKGTQGTRPTFHDLRHTYATQAIAAGLDVKTVSAVLGHANAAMTLNIYADATKDQKQRAALVMNELYGGAE